METRYTIIRPEAPSERHIIDTPETTPPGLPRISKWGRDGGGRPTAPARAMDGERAKPFARKNIQEAGEIRETSEASGIWRTAIQAGRESGVSADQRQRTPQPRQ